MARGIEKKGNIDFASHKSKVWEITEIVNPLQCQTMTILADSVDPTNKVFPATFPFLYKILNLYYL